MRSRHRSLSSPSLPPSNIFLGVFETEYVPLYEWEISGYIGNIEAVAAPEFITSSVGSSSTRSNKALSPSQLRCASGYQWDVDELEAREELMKTARKRGANAVVCVEFSYSEDGSCYASGTGVLCRQIRPDGQ